MARATVSVNDIIRTGLTIGGSQFVQPGSDGLLIQNDGKTFIEMRATAAASTVTITTPGQTGGLAIADQTVVVGGSATAMIGPFPTALFNNLDNTVYLDFNGTAGVTVGAYRIP
jgi:hypothetical protein